MRRKFIVSLLSIAVMLLVSCIISVMEYIRMSDYVSGLIADNVNSINVASRLAETGNSYNLDLLAVIGDETSMELPEFDEYFFKENCAILRSSEVGETVGSLADSVMYSYSAYMLTAMELENVLQSDFIDTRSWYFERLQPKFTRLTSDIDNLSSAIYVELEKNSETFERGFYRSVIPGIVAVGVGLLLIFMLLFFVLTGYVNPVYRMLDSLNAYKTSDKKYNYSFEGDDQLAELNQGIAELTMENQQLRKRITSLKK